MGCPNELLCVCVNCLTVHPPISTASLLRRKWSDLRGTISLRCIAHFHQYNGMCPLGSLSRGWSSKERRRNFATRERKSRYDSLLTDLLKQHNLAIYIEQFQGTCVYQMFKTMFKTSKMMSSPGLLSQEPAQELLWLESCLPSSQFSIPMLIVSASSALWRRTKTNLDQILAR